MRRALLALAVMLALPLTVAACLWDRDTPADEAKGMPEVVAVLTGRFERNPPLFYSMRLERVAKHLETHTDDLAAYDDAGVACDRLGLGDEAVSWMEKKKAQLDTLDSAKPDVKDHLYRYHANLGTFLVHRWARGGADRTKIAEVKAARDEIAKALEINPNAHFGRETYQLMAMEWIIDPPPMEKFGYLSDLLGWTQASRISPKEAHDAVRGLAGLIVLGNAWESVDVFNSLGIALQRDTLGFNRSDDDDGRNSLASMAVMRCEELIKAGKGSMHPDAPKGNDLSDALARGYFMASNDLEAAYPKLRAEADAWQKARTEFMTRRLKEGRHPDTDPKFWQGYVERPAPKLPSRATGQSQAEIKRTVAIVASITVASMVTLVVAVWAGCMAYRRAIMRRSQGKPAAVVPDLS